MLNELRLVDMIERAHTDRPNCDCGRATVLAYREGAMWLDCGVIAEPSEGRIRRLWNAASGPGHVHDRIVEVPAPQSLAA